MTCIEDYSDSTMRGMTRFYQALDELASTPSVRIAYFGDSFIEADILTADLREMLQQKYGGCGSRVCHHYVHDQWLPSHRVRHSFSGWQVILSWTPVFLTVTSWESPDITLFRIPVLMWSIPFHSIPFFPLAPATSTAATADADPIGDLREMTVGKYRCPFGRWKCGLHLVCGPCGRYFRHLVTRWLLHCVAARPPPLCSCG